MPASVLPILASMDVESARKFLLSLPFVEETQQWGDNLVYWVGDKAVGGKMLCLMDLAGGGHGVASFAAGPERYAEMLERDGLKPAPYLTRAHWIAAERWSALRHTEWQDELRAAYAIVLAKLPKRTRDGLALPARQREAGVRKRKVIWREREKPAASSAGTRKAKASAAS